MPGSDNDNKGARFLLNVDLEVISDGVSYKFDYGQTTFIDKSQHWINFLSTVTSPIPGTSTTGKSGSLSARLGSPWVAIHIVFGTVMLIL